RVGGRAEAQDRVVGQLDAVGHARRIEDEDVAAGLAPGLELGQLEGAALDGLAGVAPRRGWIIHGVALTDDLDLEVEAHRPAAQALADLVLEVVGAALLGLVARDVLLAALGDPAVADVTRAAARVDPPEGVDGVVAAGGVARRRLQRGRGAAQAGQRLRVARQEVRQLPRLRDPRLHRADELDEAVRGAGREARHGLRDD